MKSKQPMTSEQRDVIVGIMEDRRIDWARAQHEAGIRFKRLHFDNHTPEGLAGAVIRHYLPHLGRKRA